MTDMNDDQTPGEVINETISMLPRPDFLNEAAPVDTLRCRGLEGLPPGSGLLVKRGPSAGCQFRLDKPATSAGRHPGSDIFLDEVTVSRKHAEFRWENDEFHVVDLGSLNGTYVNRQAVDSAVLANGDEVQIGKFRTLLTFPWVGF